MLPVVAIVGRPNVGKSTLFNRLTRTKDAIVADFPGLTRDRQYGRGRVGRMPYIVVDTGGFEPVKTTGIVRQMANQAELAIDESDVVVFVTDARTGLAPQDERIANALRRSGKKVFLAVNKSEGLGVAHASEFYELAMGEPFMVSAAHGQGIASLMEAVLEGFEEEPEDEDGDARTIRVAVAGRPNAGKSTLINAILGEERLIAFDMPGTTRDAISVPFSFGGRDFTLIDTAGLRRKGKVFESVEKISVVKTLQAISQANVVILVVDALEGVTEHDAHIASFILEEGRSLVVAVNKIDAVEGYAKDRLAEELAHRLYFLSWARTIEISALKRRGIGHVLRAAIAAHDAAFTKLSTPKLTRELIAAVEHQAPPKSKLFRPKLRYAHQGGQNPPVIVIHGNSLETVPASYRRYLEGHFREAFGLAGTPLRIEFKNSRNPYADKKD